MSLLFLKFLSAFCSASHQYGGLGFSSGPLFGAWSPAVGLSQFGGTRRSTMGGLPKVASILPPSPGKLAASKPLFSDAGTTELMKKSQPATGHHEQSDGASRKRRLRNFSNSDHRWDGDESLGVSCGEDGCDAVSSCCCQVQSHITLHWSMCAPPPDTCSRSGPYIPTLPALRTLCCTDAAHVPGLNGCQCHLSGSTYGCEQPAQLLEDGNQRAFSII